MPDNDAPSVEQELAAAADKQEKAEKAEKAEKGENKAKVDAKAKQKAQAAQKAEQQKKAKAAAAAEREAAAQEAARSVERAKADPQSTAWALMQQYGWGEQQFACLKQLWTGESNWDYTAENPSSGAYGIPQSLPPEKMASAGGDYLSNPVTQIKWGLAYIDERYGTPCNAWAFWQAQSPHWY